VFQRQIEQKDFEAEIKHLLSPSEKMMGIAEYARQTGTSLWFSKEDMTNEKNILDALIACGQFTTCYNLLEYIIQLEREHAEVKKDKHIQQLKQDLLKDWQQFQTEPKFMVADFETL